MVAGRVRRRRPAARSARRVTARDVPGSARYALERLGGVGASHRAAQRRPLLRRPNAAAVNNATILVDNLLCSFRSKAFTLDMPFVGGTNNFLLYNL